MPALFVGLGCLSTPFSRLGLGHFQLGLFGNYFWQTVYKLSSSLLSDLFLPLFLSGKKCPI